MDKEKNRHPFKGIKEETEPYAESLNDAFLYDRYEVINGVRYDLKPSPSFNHQMIVTHLWNSLYKTCYMNGRFVVAPMDVYLDEDNHFQPDVIFIKNENLHIVKNGKIQGAPNLIAEVLSPSTGQKDKILKKDSYARFGITEYWIVDPVHRTVDQFILKDHRYDLHAVYSVNHHIVSPLYSCINVLVGDLFQDLLEEQQNT